jgi:type II secretory ATPase GspE/PulE/Tfp pilus assembly ATPase PilB-like protein
MLLREVGRPEGGLTIIAGPPGSGRTTVFYAMLREADRAGEHVVALERRTRAHVEGTTQIVSNAYDEFGPTLERLRPDRVFFDDIAGDVGTVRPEEARLAIDLALTGVQVVVTVAAPSPTAALGRLAAAGIDLAVLRAVLRNVVGLRLVQRVCQRCREDFEVEPAVLTELGLGEGASRRIAIGIGCWECGGRGYRGNSALVEVLPLADPIMAEALCSLDSAAFEGAAREAGHRLLAEKAYAALRAGLTSPTQVSSLLPGTAAS